MKIISRFLTIVLISIVFTMIFSKTIVSYYKVRTVNPDVQLMDRLVHERGLSILDQSIKENREYGFIVYENRFTGSLYVGKTQIGDVDGIRLSIGEVIVLFREPVGMFHTHGADVPGYDSENFSLVDTSETNLIAYLFTPKGVFIRYDPRNGSSQFLSYNGWRHHPTVQSRALFWGEFDSSGVWRSFHSR